QIGRDDVGVQAKTRPRADVAHHLLDHDDAGQEVGAAAAVFARNVGQQQAERAGLAPDRAIDHALFLPARVVRHDLGLDEPPHGLAEEFVLLLVGPGHRLPPCQEPRPTSGPVRRSRANAKGSETPWRAAHWTARSSWSPARGAASDARSRCWRRARAPRSWSTPSAARPTDRARAPARPRRWSPRSRRPAAARWSTPTRWPSRNR